MRGIRTRPLPQLAAAAALVMSVVYSRRPRLARLARSAAAVITTITVLFALVVAPRQTQESLLDRDRWSGLPDLATSMAVGLLLAAAYVVVGGAAAVRALAPRRRSGVVSSSGNGP